MKELILVMLMVMALANTCLAQMGPNRRFSIENTLWQTEFLRDNEKVYLGFSNGDIYDCKGGKECINYKSNPWIVKAYYINLPLFSYVYLYGAGYFDYYTAIKVFMIAFLLSWLPNDLPPEDVSGSGIVYVSIISPLVPMFFSPAYKVDDNWMPSSD